MKHQGLRFTVGLRVMYHDWNISRRAPSLELLPRPKGIAGSYPRKKDVPHGCRDSHIDSRALRRMTCNLIVEVHLSGPSICLNPFGCLEPETLNAASG